MLDPFQEEKLLARAWERLRPLAPNDEACQKRFWRLVTFRPAGSGNEKRKKAEEGPAVFVEPDYELDWQEASDAGQPEEARWVSQETPIELVKGTLVVSICGRSKTKALHQIGRCHE